MVRYGREQDRLPASDLKSRLATLHPAADRIIKFIKPDLMASGNRLIAGDIYPPTRTAPKQAGASSSS